MENLQTLCIPNVNQLLAGLSGWSGYCLPVPYLHWNSKFHSQKPLPFGLVCLRNKLIAAVQHHPCCDSCRAQLYCLGWRSEAQLPAGFHLCTLELLLSSSCWGSYCHSCSHETWASQRCIKVTFPVSDATHLHKGAAQCFWVGKEVLRSYKDLQWASGGWLGRVHAGLAQSRAWLSHPGGVRRGIQGSLLPSTLLTAL